MHETLDQHVISYCTVPTNMERNFDMTLITIRKYLLEKICSFYILLQTTFTSECKQKRFARHAGWSVKKWVVKHNNSAPSFREENHISLSQGLYKSEPAVTIKCSFYQYVLTTT